MDGAPSTVNGTVRAVENALQIAEYDGLVKLAYSALVAQFPFLAWPIVSTVVQALITAFADKFFVPLNNAVAFKIIDLQTEIETSAYNRAIAVLSTAQASGVNHEQALADAREALARLIHSDGS